MGDRARPTDRYSRQSRKDVSRKLESDLAWAPTHTLTNPFTEVVDHSAAVSILAAGLRSAPVLKVNVTPSGRIVLDFGQNLVGWVRFTVDGEAGSVVTLRHAEVLEGGELGIRTLRNARATDRYTLRGGGPETWEPTFTFHGFRYVEVDGWPDGDSTGGLSRVVAIHSDMERTGSFTVRTRC